MNAICKNFIAAFASEENTSEAILDVFKKTGSWLLLFAELLVVQSYVCLV